MKRLGREMATHARIPLWKALWTEEPGGLRPMGSQESDTTKPSYEEVGNHRNLALPAKAGQRES